jgi:hypothetical protein
MHRASRFYRSKHTRPMRYAHNVWHHVPRCFRLAATLARNVYGSFAFATCAADVLGSIKRLVCVAVKPSDRALDCCVWINAKRALLNAASVYLLLPINRCRESKEAESNCRVCAFDVAHGSRVFRTVADSIVRSRRLPAMLSCRDTLRRRLRSTCRVFRL